MTDGQRQPEGRRPHHQVRGQRQARQPRTVVKKTPPLELQQADTPKGEGHHALARRTGSLIRWPMELICAAPTRNPASASRIRRFVVTTQVSSLPSTSQAPGSLRTAPDSDAGVHAHLIRRSGPRKLPHGADTNSATRRGLTADGPASSNDLSRGTRRRREWLACRRAGASSCASATRKGASAVSRCENTHRIVVCTATEAAQRHCRYSSAPVDKATREAGDAFSPHPPTASRSPPKRTTPTDGGERQKRRHKGSQRFQ
jgi:hypothetical protein